MAHYGDFRPENSLDMFQCPANQMVKSVSATFELFTNTIRSFSMFCEDGTKRTLGWTTTEGPGLFTIDSEACPQGFIAAQYSGFGQKNLICATDNGGWKSNLLTVSSCPRSTTNNSIQRIVGANIWYIPNDSI